jgi:hypothetical protein
VGNRPARGREDRAPRANASDRDHGAVGSWQTSICIFHFAICNLPAAHFSDGPGGPSHGPL